jgi:UDP-N-acetyl-D-mannosaminuronic acid dehydrogenase
MKVCVVGLGYIGFPTALLFAKAGNTVVGVDVNKEIVAGVNSGASHIKEKEVSALFADPGVKKRVSARETPCEADAFIVAVPTPITGEKKADLSFVEKATESVAKVLRKGNLVVIESTVPPGTCRKVVAPIIEEKNGLRAGRDYFLAHCPERAFPGNLLKELVENDRIIGGINGESGEKAKELYAGFVRGKIFLTDDVTAELCKLSENAFRDVNVAFANELANAAEELGVNALELIELANKHPRVKILKPGIGVGGHCIAVDPWFIVEAVKDAKLLKTAREINDSMPRKTVEKVRKKLAGIRDPKIVAVGMSYKPNVADVRESPALEVVELLEEAGFEVKKMDPLVKGFEYSSLWDAARGSDCLLVLVEHDVVAKELSESLDEIKKGMRHPIILRYPFL